MEQKAPRPRYGKSGNLTKPQEIFVQELVKGETQRQAYLKAYPKKKKIKESSLDVMASLLFKKTKIQERYSAVLNQMRDEEQKATKWTREQSIETLRYVINKNKEDLERVEKAYEDELTTIAEMVQQDPEKAAGLMLSAIQRRKTRRMSNVYNQGIIEAVSELNKMQGFNEETINLNSSVVFTGEDELAE
jgi:CRISPR/Cas system CMR subunit Cmr6 (Cas7 group RAMP superfamily)